MSELARAVLNSVALEADRIRNSYRDASALALPAYLGEELPMPGVPTRENTVEAENLVPDPLGGGGSWDTYWAGVSTPIAAVAISDLPRFPYAVKATATGAVNFGPKFQSPVAGLHYLYALIKTDVIDATAVLALSRAFGSLAAVGEIDLGGAISFAGWTVISGSATIPAPVTTLKVETTLPTGTIQVNSTAEFPTSGTVEIGEDREIVNYTGTTAESLTGCTGGAATLPAGTTVTRTEPGPYRLTIKFPSAVATNVVYMTAATVCAHDSFHPDQPLGVDPGEPFTGDLGTSPRNSYAWRGGRFVSPSVRYGPTFDLMALREDEANFSVDPVGLTMEQRQRYLLARWQARRKPWGETFVNLIVSVIQGEIPNFTADSVRVVEDLDSYAFRMEIGYSPSGVLASRVRQLIDDIKPAHLNYLTPPITWGTFRADISKADIDKV